MSFLSSGMTTTRGGLSPAKLKNLATNDVVNFMFNPAEFTISKSVEWCDTEENGVDAAQAIFKRGGPRSIDLTLLFDTQDSGGDVTYYTVKLWKMTTIESSTQNSTTGKGTPPVVEFTWGNLYFKALVTSISETFTLFSDTGVPLRSSVTVNLREQVEPGANDSLSTGSNTAPPSSVITSGLDRLDNIAALAGIGAMFWRDVATANDVDNPLSIPTGTELVTGDL
ncbi:MAG: hypothetical protein AAF125_06625 [Chloroflexota bacterium]